jgi:tetratricopeptide (TPR) repeat protein
MAGEPFVPTDDAAVVARLRPSGTSSSERELRGLKRLLSEDPTRVSLAVDVARRFVIRAGADGDLRLLGQARWALSPWWDQPAGQVPVEVLLLRARIRQCLHDFSEAMEDLRSVLERDPRHIPAWWMQSTLHCVRGDYGAARVAVVQLMRLADPLTATAAAAQWASLTGQSGEACVRLEEALGRAGDVDSEAVDMEGVAIRVWAETLLGEIHAREGRLEEAERHYDAASRRAPRDPYLLGAWADLMLERGQPDRVLSLLEPFRGQDGLLLRWVEAATRVGRGSAVEGLRELERRFAVSRARGDRVHLREEARFELRLKRNPVRALELARENWAVQREPADARLLGEAARAAGDSETAGEAQRWAQRWRWPEAGLRNAGSAITARDATGGVP